MQPPPKTSCVFDRDNGLLSRLMRIVPIKSNSLVSKASTINVYRHLFFSFGFPDHRDRTPPSLHVSRFLAPWVAAVLHRK